MMGQVVAKHLGGSVKHWSSGAVKFSKRSPLMRDHIDHGSKTCSLTGNYRNCLCPIETYGLDSESRTHHAQGLR